MPTFYQTLLLATFAFAISTQQAGAQGPSEDALIPSEVEIQTPPKTVPMKGRIKPLFWKAEIGKSALFIPLQEIEFASVQNYKVVSSVLQQGRDVITEKSEAIRVRELTISTKSHNFIRIYYFDKLNDAANQEGDQVSTLKELERLRGKLATAKDQPYPVKHYPQTTHQHMVEYRVASENDVEKLYESLQETLIDFHAYQLIDDQKQDTVSKVRAGESK
ncbi:MAG: hypothetical protein ACI9R3_001167 [Verrucomicrobiales bacterium]|jgi:hypothetical protein